MKYYKAGLTSIVKSLSYSINEDLIFTPSTYFNNTFPDCCLLSWVNTEDKKKQIFKEKLIPSSIDYSLIEKMADELFELDKFQWPNLFSEYQSLNDFSKFCRIETNDQIYYSISFPEIEIEDLIKKLRPNGPNIGEPGLYKNIIKMSEESRDITNAYGFDIIGMEIGGVFYSLHNFELRKKLEIEFDINFNNYGLIASLDDCIKIINIEKIWENLEENVPWFICRIDKKIHPTTAST